MRLPALLLFALFTSAAAAADIYTWKDKQGQVHYSDNPPPAPTSVRTLDQSAPPPAAAQRSSVADQELEFRKRRAAASEAQAKADQEKAAAAEKRRNCEVARGQLTALESGQRIVRTRTDGEREYLDDAQRTAEITRARKAVSDWCK